jgi:NodT family efflux transporter outer membrane factor (OMF) lipoprotein
MYMRVLTTVGLLALSGCVVGPDYDRPEIEVGKDWSDGPRMAAAEENFVGWWRGLGDPTLTRLVEQALSDNLSVRQALERVVEARERRATVTANYYPGVSAQSSATIERQSANANPAIGNIPGLNRNQESFDASGQLSWEVDLFGRTRRAAESADAYIGAALADANGARLSVATETAQTYLEMRGFQAELAAHKASIAAIRRTLGLVELQYKEGEVPRVAIVQTRVELRRLKAEVPLLKANIRAAALALGVLTGRLPEAEVALAETERERIDLKPLPVGQRADLLRRRPDVALAERLLAAETAEIGVAKADLFPRLTISALGGFRSLDASTLFDSASTHASITPFLSWRIFDGGRVRAEIRLTEAEARRAALNYEQNVLTALGEAETALTRYDLGLETIALRRTAIDAAQENFELAELRYREGDISLLELLDAERSVQNTRRAEATTYRQTAVGLVTLYKALGGGWQSLPGTEPAGGGS